MKKLFLVLALAFAGIFTANAQVWIGGSANATVNKEVTKFGVAPEIGYSFKAIPFTIAVGANYGYYKGTAPMVDENNLPVYDENGNPEMIDVKLNPIVLSPYIRYSVCTIKNNEGVDKFAMFLDLTGDFGLKDCKGYRVGLQPGIAWMATKHWTAAFRFAFIGYNNFEGTDVNGSPIYGDKGFRFDFASTTGPTFGLYYNF